MTNERTKLDVNYRKYNLTVFEFFKAGIDYEISLKIQCNV